MIGPPFRSSSIQVQPRQESSSSQSSSFHPQPLVVVWQAFDFSQAPTAQWYSVWPILTGSPIWTAHWVPYLACKVESTSARRSTFWAGNDMTPTAMVVKIMHSKNFMFCYLGKYLVGQQQASNERWLEMEGLQELLVWTHQWLWPTLYAITSVRPGPLEHLYKQTRYVAQVRIVYEGASWGKKCLKFMLVLLKTTRRCTVIPVCACESYKRTWVRGQGSEKWYALSSTNSRGPWRGFRTYGFKYAENPGTFSSRLAWNAVGSDFVTD